jgi:hypothetical protein
MRDARPRELATDRESGLTATHDRTSTRSDIERPSLGAATVQGLPPPKGYEPLAVIHSRSSGRSCGASSTWGMRP